MTGVLTLVGGLWVGSKAVSIMRWYFFTNRDGDSGRYKHWSDE